MNKKAVFVCEYCGLEFDNEAGCKEHEKTHVKNYSFVSNKEIAKELDYLGAVAYSYRFGNKVMGMPIESFENLMGEAAKRLREVKDEHN